jgi:hypothetical protein
VPETAIGVEPERVWLVEHVGRRLFEIVFRQPDRLRSVSRERRLVSAQN